VEPGQLLRQLQEPRQQRLPRRSLDQEVNVIRHEAVGKNRKRSAIASAQNLRYENVNQGRVDE
jgi:hypothetical protein